MKRIAPLLAMMFGFALLAQENTDRPETVQVQRGVLTHYYDLDVELGMLQDSREVTTILVEEEGGTAYYSFDTEEEALAAMGEKGASRFGSVYCICYQNINYGGSSIVFPGWDYNDLGSIGWNDKISSYQCFGGGTFTGRADKNYNGASYNFSGYNLNLHYIGWGDRISSIVFDF